MQGLIFFLLSVNYFQEVELSYLLVSLIVWGIALLFAVFGVVIWLVKSY
jgi:hypothetical protein